VRGKAAKAVFKSSCKYFQATENEQISAAIPALNPAQQGQARTA
jgi:hypothetical protein